MCARSTTAPATKCASICASKAGLLGLMRCAAIEGAPNGVTCDAINPGVVNT
ncbi:MAG: SDR family oxidoreductase [Alphaproteobacteria bacterium]|nr:SDR family oxidoreductase [Alphaproteobacteria bacterium]